MKVSFKFGQSPARQKSRILRERRRPPKPGTGVTRGAAGVRKKSVLNRKEGAARKESADYIWRLSDLPSEQLFCG